MDIDKPTVVASPLQETFVIFGPPEGDGPYQVALRTKDGRLDPFFIGWELKQARAVKQSYEWLAKRFYKTGFRDGAANSVPTEPSIEIKDQ